MSRCCDFKPKYFQSFFPSTSIMFQAFRNSFVRTSLNPRSSLSTAASKAKPAATAAMKTSTGSEAKSKTVSNDSKAQASSSQIQKEDKRSPPSKPENKIVGPSDITSLKRYLKDCKSIDSLNEYLVATPPEFFDAKVCLECFRTIRFLKKSQIKPPPLHEKVFQQLLSSTLSHEFVDDDALCLFRDLALDQTYLLDKRLEDFMKNKLVNKVDFPKIKSRTLLSVLASFGKTTLVEARTLFASVEPGFVDLTTRRLPNKDLAHAFFNSSFLSPILTSNLFNTVMTLNLKEIRSTDLTLIAWGFIRSKIDNGDYRNQLLTEIQNRDLSSFFHEDKFLIQQAIKKLS